jgi:fibronectin type 3 domain-containing protein
MAIAKTLCARAGAVAALLLLALPSLAAANPGKGPTLVRRSGQFVIVHADGRDGRSTRQAVLRDGLTRTPVRPPADEFIEPGARVRLEGTMQNGTLVVADSVSAVQQTAPAALEAGAPRLAASPSMHNTAVVLFGFTGGPTHTQLTTDQPSATTEMFGDPQTTPDSLNAYYQEQTYGQIGFSGTVFGPFDIAGPTGTCSQNDFYTWAAQAENATGMNDSAFQHWVFVFPDVPACGWSGLAEIGGPHVWINGSFEVPVIAHELGHNLGISHAGGLSCTASGVAAPMGDSCTIDRTHYQLPQYADPYDAMGNFPVLRQMNMEHKLALGLLPASAVQTVAASGTYQLAPMETLGASVELLRLPKPGGGSYFVEYRRPVGFFDSQSPAVAGVLVHTESPDLVDPNPSHHGDSDTSLIDMHPGAVNSNQWTDAAMTVGQVFDDPIRGISIQNLAQSSTGATLAITMPADTTPPSRPGRLTAVVSGTSVALQWTPASDDFSVASYTVARDGAALGSTQATSFADSGLTPGTTVNYAVTATDAAGNIGPASTMAVTLPDTLAPSVPASVTASVTRDGRVHVAWAAATDNVGVVSYRVLRDGTGIAQPTGTSYTDTAARPGAGATVSYSVVAFDQVGNASGSGSAPPVRAALLRQLGASHLKVKRARKSSLVQVTGVLSDVKAICRLRLGRGPWHRCKVKPTSAFAVSARGKRVKQVTLSLRDELGRVRLQTLRVR